MLYLKQLFLFLITVNLCNENFCMRWLLNHPARTIFQPVNVQQNQRQQQQQQPQLQQKQQSNQPQQQQQQQTEQQQEQVEEMTNSPSRTKTDWVYIRRPRAGLLSVLTDEGKSLSPGSLNCRSNKLKLDVFNKDLKITFPSARKGAVYTVVIYRDKFLAKAVANVKGEDLYKGELKGLVVANFLDIKESEKEQLFNVEIYEQKKDKLVPDKKYDRNDWNKILSGWNDILTGSAGKTCFVIKPKNSDDDDDEDDLISILENYM